MEEVAFHRIQQLDEEYLKHVAGVLKLKDTSTKTISIQSDIRVSQLNNNIHIGRE